LDSVVYQFETIGKTFWTPTAAMKALQKRPTWVVLFLVVFGINACFSYVMVPFAERAAVGQIQLRAPDARPYDPATEQRVLTQVRRGQLIGVLLSPVVLLGKWLFVAGLFWALTVLSGGDAAFRPFFAMIAHANLPLVLGWYVGLTGVAIRGADHVASLADITPRLGLNLFIRSDRAWIDSVLNNLNLLEVWYVALLVMGLMAVGGRSWRWSLTAAVGVWLAAVAFQATMANLGQAAMKLG
jgi:hypothetical protein